jgi:polyisoprenoid-binding protein YceI
VLAGYGFALPVMIATSTISKRSMSMRQLALGCVFASSLLAAAVMPAGAADNYVIDSVHSGVTFKIKHFDLAWIPGRFNEFGGSFLIDDDPAKCVFQLDVKTTSIDTNNPQRNDHLRSPDFFDAKQFPAITFKSTGVKSIKGGYEVTGDLKMHGVTKPISFSLLGGGKAEFQGPRTGFTTDLTLKLSDFGIGTKFGKMLSDDVHVTVSFEGMKKK